MKIKERDRISGKETGEARVPFRAVPVFDRAQVTAGEHAAPLEPPCEPLSGDSHEHLLEPVERSAGSLGFTVSFETIDGSCGGWCDHRRRRIVVDAGRADSAGCRMPLAAATAPAESGMSERRDELRQAASMMRNERERAPLARRGDT